MEDYKTKYEIAINQAKEELKACGDLNCDAARQIFRFFPELKESGDEKIRKMLVEQMERWHKCAIENNVVQDIKDSADAIAWLEKQDPKKHEEELEKAYKTADEVQYRKGFEDGVASVKPVEWSEDGEMMINTIIYDLERHGGKEDSNYSAEINWLKSLKERYIWKPSEEQTNALYNIVSENLKDACRTKDDVLLEQLLNDLMKLKGE